MICNQGVALLPFIDEKRLLDAMAPRYPALTEDEVKRNKWGNNFIFVFEDCPLYSSLEALYGKRKNKDVSAYILANTRILTGSAARTYRRES